VKRVVGILFLIGVVYLGLQWLELDEPVLKESSAKVIAEETVLTKPKTAKPPQAKSNQPQSIDAPQVNATATITQVASPSGTPTNQQPEKGKVEFEVKGDGLAIAFGDIVLGKVVGDDNLKKGFAAAGRSRLWDSSVIPYSINEGVANLGAIQEAINIFHSQTSVRFVPYDGQPDSVVFVPGQDMCASYLGRSGGGQPIYIGPNCGTNEVMHELMHALGFVHEQSRTDRDKYVEILWNNIDPQYHLQFWIVPDEYVHEYVGSVFAFDTESIMLYDPTAFAKVPGTLSMRSRSSSELRPSRKQFSRTDRERLQYLYGQ
jgi:hypothetical protein